MTSPLIVFTLLAFTAIGHAALTANTWGDLREFGVDKTLQANELGLFSPKVAAGFITGQGPTVCVVSEIEREIRIKRATCSALPTAISVAVGTQQSIAAKNASVFRFSMSRQLPILYGVVYGFNGFAIAYCADLRVARGLRQQQCEMRIVGTNETGFTLSDPIAFDGARVGVPFSQGFAYDPSLDAYVVLTNNPGAENDVVPYFVDGVTRNITYSSKAFFSSSRSSTLAVGEDECLVAGFIPKSMISGLVLLSAMQRGKKFVDEYMIVDDPDGIDTIDIAYDDASEQFGLLYTTWDGSVTRVKLTQFKLYCECNATVDVVGTIEIATSEIGPSITPSPSSTTAFLVTYVANNRTHIAAVAPDNTFTNTTLPSDNFDSRKLPDIAWINFPNNKPSCGAAAVVIRNDRSADANCNSTVSFLFADATLDAIDCPPPPTLAPTTEAPQTPQAPQTQAPQAPQSPHAPQAPQMGAPSASIPTAPTSPTGASTPTNAPSNAVNLIINVVVVVALVLLNL